MKAIWRRIGSFLSGPPKYYLPDLSGVTVVPDLEEEQLLMLSNQRRTGLYYPDAVPLTGQGLPDDELVLGVDWNDELKAYPLSVLKYSHLVNDMVGSSPFLVTFCLLCFSGVGLDPVVDGETLTFHIVGVHKGVSAMADDATGTIWDSLTGRALVGSLAGRQLAQVPVSLVSVRNWLNAFPESLSIDVAEFGGVQEVRPRTTNLGAGDWSRTLGQLDNRLPPRTLVIGARSGDRAKAWSMDSNGRSSHDPGSGPWLVQSHLGDVPVALLAVKGGWPLVYDRRLDGVVVELRLSGERVLDEMGTEWDGWGRAVSGPRSGSRLSFVPSNVVQWYSWVAHFPDTEVEVLPHRVKRFLRGSAGA